MTERFKAQGIKNERDSLLPALKMESAMWQRKQAASSYCEQRLANSQPGTRDVSPSSARS